MKTSTIILLSKFQGPATESNFKIIEQNLPSLKAGQFLTQAHYISVDPYQRLFSGDTDVGNVVLGEQVGQIIESKNSKYPVGEYVLGEFGWRVHTIADATPGAFLQVPPRILKDYGNLPRSLALSALGMTGSTAYFGLLDVCKPKRGDTVVVSAAAGAVGLHVGQIAKIKGCKVVGITGSNAKGERLTKEFNFDGFVNYKSHSFQQDLENATPDRVDCYFDNVGGELSSMVLNRMNKFGRVAIAGSISTYNTSGPAKASEVQTPVKIHHLRMEGFAVMRWRSEWDTSVKQNLEWISDGKLKYAETVTEGFENLPKAFLEVFRGGNFGKAIVKV